MKLRDGTWHAVWQQQGVREMLGEFTGTKQDAIAWARQRARECWIYSEEIGDIILADPAP